MKMNRLLSSTPNETSPSLKDFKLASIRSCYVAWLIHQKLHSGSQTISIWIEQHKMLVDERKNPCYKSSVISNSFSTRKIQRNEGPAQT